MFDSVKDVFERCLDGLSRRELFRRGGLMAAAPALFKGVASAAPAAAPTLTVGKLKIGPDIYQSIGVRPVINCRGTLTVVGGSLELPEVRAAQVAAAGHYAVLDELMEGIATRIAEITGAEWALVSSGCEAGIAHTTAACVAHGNPDLHVRIPDLAGFPRDEVVIPSFCRNQYDQGVRSVGVRVIEVHDAAGFEAALGPKVAMVYIMASPRLETGALTYDQVYSIAKKKGVPVFCDAAAEMPTVRPNLHLQRGATFVGYSGGKCMRGPQSAGVILGQKALLKAAWMASAPHHGHGRAMKVGKEEAMGMLAAIEKWVERDHEAEDKKWISWMNNIKDRVTKIDGVTGAVRIPKGLDNHSPGLTVSWDTSKVAATGAEITQLLWDTEPRVALGGGGRGGARATDTESISISAYMMETGEDKIVGDRVFELLNARRGKLNRPAPKSPVTDLTGQWDVEIEFAAGSGNHTLYLKQEGNKVVGTHQGDFVARDLNGTIDGNEVAMNTASAEAHGANISFKFTGKVAGDTMSGPLDMGEYMGAKWTAKRHVFGRRGPQAG